MQIYIDIYIRISLGGYNLGTFYARKLKFGLLPRPKSLTILDLPLSPALDGARGQNV